MWISCRRKSSILSWTIFPVDLSSILWWLWILLVSSVFYLMIFCSSVCVKDLVIFTSISASNGDPRVPQSLHYIDPSGRPNSYQQVRIRLISFFLRQQKLANWFIHQAILGVGEVLQFYDNDRRFPAWGFGARTQGHVSHCFNLNTATNDSEVRFS